MYCIPGPPFPAKRKITWPRRRLSPSDFLQRL
jgi:hypothetical protein